MCWQQYLMGTWLSEVSSWSYIWMRERRDNESVFSYRVFARYQICPLSGMSALLTHRGFYRGHATTIREEGHWVRLSTRSGKKSSGVQTDRMCGVDYTDGNRDSLFYTFGLILILSSRDINLQWKEHSLWKKKLSNGVKKNTLMIKNIRKASNNHKQWCFHCTQLKHPLGTRRSRRLKLIPKCTLYS